MRPWFTMPFVVRSGLPGRATLLVATAALTLAACSSAGAPSTAPSVAAATAVPTSSLSASAASADPGAAGSASPSAAADGAWHVVAVGDSIPFNSPDDCPGCTGFVDGYAARLQAATGHKVVATNLSQHNGLQATGLSPELSDGGQRADAIAAADVVIVSIGHNDTPWNVTDDKCDGVTQWDDPIESNIPAARKYTPACATASADAYQPLLASIYRRITELRAGKPTVLLALNTYNDILGWCELRGCNGPDKTPPELNRAATIALDAWNPMICDTAKATGFTCADVYHLFNGEQGTTPAGDLLGADYTHPSQAGNDRIADYLLSLGHDALQP